MRRVAILGAGVSGLAAALYLHDAAAQRGIDLAITVFERSARAGGCVQTLYENGYTIELGPDSMLVDKPAARTLLRRLRLEDELVPIREEYRGALIVHRGKLHTIPSEFRLFSPTSLPALLKSGIFSPAGIARATLEPLLRARTSSEDESLASFVTRRFGREVLDRLAQPLIGGIYSGDPQRMSMQATLPQFVEMERRYGSVIRGMARARNSAAPQLMSLRGGLQRIVDALLAQVGSLVRVSSEVQTLRHDGAGWHVDFADGSRAQADGIICTLPAYAAARILRGVDPQLAELLESIRYNSIATVNVAYDAEDVPPLPRTPGFVVPAIEGRRITAATISTQKYPDRSPKSGVLLRAFVGGALQPQLVESADARLAQIARDEFADLLKIRAEPRFAVTRRWMRLLPEYAVGHVGLVASIEQRAAALGGLALAGSAYRGVGIPDCVASGQAAAARLLSGCELTESG
jgi:oxygen-dependent protoporphyrinogen oxidase